jgi:hypothetical protein
LIKGFVRDFSSKYISKIFHILKEKEGIASGPYRLIKSKERGTYVQFPIAVKKVKRLGYEDLEDK